VYLVYLVNLGHEALQVSKESLAYQANQGIFPSNSFHFSEHRNGSE